MDVAGQRAGAEGRQKKNKVSWPGSAGGFLPTRFPHTDWEPDPSSLSLAGPSLRDHTNSKPSERFAMLISDWCGSRMRAESGSCSCLVAWRCAPRVEVGLGATGGGGGVGGIV